jgi:multiple sugar transport system permease protein
MAMTLRCRTCGAIIPGRYPVFLLTLALAFITVIMMLIIPPQTIIVPVFMKFRFFIGFINLIDTPFPILIMALTTTGLKNGLYIFMFRQFFKNVPNELNEAASIDGCGVYRTFFKIMMPTAIPMLTTVFLLSFSWQWTDILYNSLFYKSTLLLSNVVSTVSTGELQALAGNLTNVAALLAVLPLALLYIFAQRAFVESIDRAGIVG